MEFEGRFVAPGDRAGQGRFGAAAEGLLESRPQERCERVEGVPGSEPGSGQRVPRSRDEPRQAVCAERRREVVQRAIPGLDRDGSAPEAESQTFGCRPARPRAVDGEGDSPEPRCVGRRAGKGLEGMAGTCRQPPRIEGCEDLGSV